MKEATGELNMTVVTLIAVAAVGALFYLFVWPMIQRSIVTQTCRTYGVDWVAYSFEVAGNNGSNAEVMQWVCCPKDAAQPADWENANAGGCVKADLGNDAAGGSGDGDGES